MNVTFKLYLSYDFKLQKIYIFLKYLFCRMLAFIKVNPLDEDRKKLSFTYVY